MEAFTAASALENPTTVVKRIFDRSLMRHVVSMQWDVAFREHGYRPFTDARALAQERSRGVLQSVPIERLFNVQKNGGQARGEVNVSVPAKCMGIAVSFGVVGLSNGFELVQSTIPVERSTASSTQAARAFHRPPWYWHNKEEPRVVWAIHVETKNFILLHHPLAKIAASSAP